MSDSEEDYMSDKLLQTCSDDVRPGLIFSRADKRQHEMYKKKLEQEKLQKSQPEKSTFKRKLEEGLNTAISSDNKGYKMLEKLGFKPGDSLGKSKDGLKEPIKITVKQGTSGVGMETHLKEKAFKRYKGRTINMTNKINEFKTAAKEKRTNHLLRKDFNNAKKVCEELDQRCKMEEPLEEFFWTTATIQRLKYDEMDEEEYAEYCEEFVSEENLHLIIDYLRIHHLYCMYCAFVANDENDLKTACPGPYRNDHDDD